jgi:iron(III) transport system substrate-binding protein
MMSRMHELSARIVLLGAWLLAAALPAAAQQPTSFDARFADLIKAAKAEGQVTWYQGVLEQGGTGFAAHFQNRFGIRVNHQFMASGPIYERFRTESASRQHIADVFSSGDAGPMLAAMKAGFIAKYDTASKALYPKGWVYDLPNATAYPTQRVQMAVAYNTRQMKPDEVKGLTTWKNLLDPKFADGKLALGDPTRSLTAFSLYFYMLRVNEAEYGRPFLDKLAAQKPVVYSSHTQEGARIAAGEVPIGVIVDIIAINQYDLGAPIAIVYPSPTPVILQHTAMSQNAPHPNAAKLFLEYITSEEGLAEWKKSSGGLTGLPGLDAKRGLKYTSEPWYREPKDFFIAEDGTRDMAEEFKRFAPIWKEVFK